MENQNSNSQNQQEPNGAAGSEANQTQQSPVTGADGKNQDAPGNDAGDKSEAKGKGKGGKANQTQQSPVEETPERKAYVAAFNRFFRVFGVAPHDLITTEVLTELADAEENKATTNSNEVGPKAEAVKYPDLVLKHKDEEYIYPAAEKKNFIVRHSRMTQHASGQETEDPGSVRIQIYRPETYADLINENEKTGEANAFVQGGEKTIVLHDPTKND